MSKRLQVVLGDAELRRFQRVAKRSGLTLSEWVRQVLRGAAQARATGDPARRIGAIRSAARHAYPTADIEQMLDEIERGYCHGSH